MKNEYGAGDGTRTRDQRLGRPLLYQLSYARLSGGGGRIRTCEGVEPGDLQSPAFGRLATPPISSTQVEGALKLL